MDHMDVLEMQQVLLPSEISSLVMKCLHTFPGTLHEVSQQLVDESHEKARASDKWDNKSMQESQTSCKNPGCGLVKGPTMSLLQ